MKILSTPHRVHVAKTFTWRFIASTTTFLLSWFFTGSLAIGATIGGSEAIIKMFFYYAHERAWFSYENAHKLRG
jgi:uncharacterized membrane protein